jgi:hypothetical protein
MKSVNKEVKTLLAKLLATEDIHVVHKNIPTAYFDTRNRELGLPILKNMSGDTYDMMTLHEVGHALWTDPEEWGAIVNEDNDDDLPKTFINVTEDVRIERKIKDKYPGGRRAFKTAYDKLYKDNFFGTAGREISESNLADRINLHSKIGDTTGLVFEDKEAEIYDLCKNAVTFDDAIEAARALYAYCKDVEDMDDTEYADDHEWSFSDEESEEMDDIESDMMGESPFEMESDEETDGDSGMKGDSKSDDEESDSSGNSPADKFKEEIEKSMDEMKSENESKSEEKTEEKSDTEEDGSSKELKREGGFGMGKTTNSMQASTVVEWEDRKRDLNTDDGKEYWYVNLPESKTDHIVNYKRLLKVCEEEYASASNSYKDASYRYLNDFEKESMKTVSYMLKEFEMKKSADAYVRASISKTGQLDMTKVHSYKYNEDLFKKITIMPGEKNHGLVILVDWSGSMYNVIHNAYKQLMQIVWFCRRAGIKFEVFAFSDSGFCLLEESVYRTSHDDRQDDPFASNSFNFKLGDMSMSDHVLINFFSDKMSKSETKKMAHYLCMTTISMMGRGYSNHHPHLLEDYWTADGNPWWDTPHGPSGLSLGGTPLNASIVSMINFVPKYRKANGIQNLNCVLITDGASNCDGGKFVEKTRTDRNGSTSRWIGTEASDWNATTFIHDPITKKNHKVDGRGRRENMTDTYLKILKDRANCNVLGFYLAQSSGTGTVRKNDLNWLFPNQNHDAVRSELRKNKMAIADSFGYDEYYVIPSGNMNTDADELAVDSTMTKGKMAKAFAKHMKSKTVNRVLLNKFIEKVA